MKNYFQNSILVMACLLSSSCGVKLADNIARSTSSPSPSSSVINISAETLGQIDFRRVLSGDRSSIINYETRVIDNETDFIGLWDDYTGGKTNPLFIPKVDFALKNVVAIFMGERPTTGFSTDITKIIENKDSINISIKENRPIPGQEVKAEITQPFLFIETKKSKKRFIIENLSVTSAKTENLEFNNIESGYDSGIKDFTKRIAKTEKEFSDLYKEHLSAQKTVNTIVFPKIDFKTDMVAAIFLGERPSSGYNITIEKVTKTGSQVVIQASESTPQNNPNITKVITYPYQFIRIPKSDLSIKFDINLTVPQSGIINETSTNNTSKTLTVRSFISGENSNIQGSQYLLIQSKEDFRNIWSQHAGSAFAVVPEVDFNNNSLIAVFSGVKNTSGYIINVNSAIESNNDLRVFVDLSKDTAQSRNISTSPFSMALIPKTYKNPTFIVNNISAN